MLTVDLKNNTVVRPLIEEARRAVRLDGETDLLASPLTKRFLPLPEAFRSRLAAGTEAQIEQCFDRFFDAQTLDELFA
jgi:hypothetical protein